jgi:hypothetical protein
VRKIRIAIYDKALERLPAEKFFTAEEVAALGREALRDAGIREALRDAGIFVDDEDAAGEEPAPS